MKTWKLAKQKQIKKIKAEGEEDVYMQILVYLLNEAIMSLHQRD